MLFSSIVFLYCFLPALIILSLVFRKRGKNAVIFGFSLFFYAWGEPRYLFLMLGSIVGGYIFGRILEMHRRKAVLAAACAFFIALLSFFKYTDFVISGLGSIFGMELPLLRLALPAGISFYLFQILSYIIDVYRGDYPAEHNFLNFATYVSFFPQLVAGPIVRYPQVKEDLRKRDLRMNSIAAGAQRFVFGLAKKILIADVFGGLCQIYYDQASHTGLMTWLYVCAFTLQIYYDFSGYSDMAIGLGRILGFEFPENFNFPYIASSVTDFWRRWHMTLSGWFRDYVYIPMGGNRVSKPRWMINILVVWALTGLWHGAGLNFILWGLWFAVLLVLEKLVLSKVFAKCRPLGHVFAAFGIIFGWVLFDASSLFAAWSTVRQMFSGTSDALSVYYLKSYAVVFVMAAVGATPILRKLYEKVMKNKVGTNVMSVLAPVVTALLLLLCTAYLVDGSFQPFLYFRF